MPQVSFKRLELRELVPQYDLIRDCVKGETAIKRAREKYLPRPNALDTSRENTSRYEAYLTRALFYNATRRTLFAMTGQVFMREPVFKVPAELNPVIEDATGMGVSLVQLAKEACSVLIAHGRGGLFTDYPETDGSATSRADIEAGLIRPTIAFYEPWRVLNWRTVTIGGKKVLSLVVLEEEYETFDDGFATVSKKQWRELRLVNGRYRLSIWRDEIQPLKTTWPTDAKGEPIDRLPFTFIGAENNDPTIDPPPLYDLSSVNVAHYRNSADHEESAFMLGQPTPYYAGLSKEWVDDVLKGEVQVGARAAIPLPVGATAGLLQPNPNTLASEAMVHKEKQMASLGAKLVENRSVQRTATETNFDQADETSTLANCANNVAAALTFALSWACQFTGASEAGLMVKLNTQFDLVKLTPQDRTQLLLEWQSGAITWEEYRDNLRRGGIASLDDKVAKQRIADDIASAPQLHLLPGAATTNQPGATNLPAGGAA
jgi:hypothetical protein